MRVNPAQINAYTQKIDRPLTRTGAVLDVTTARGSAAGARPLPGHRPEGEGAIQGVLTPEESRFIAALFPQGRGQWRGTRRPGAFGGADLNGSDRGGGLTGADAKAGQVYTHAGRPMPGAIPGIRLDLKG
jgi:hypothetical protein